MLTIHCKIWTVEGFLNAIHSSTKQNFSPVVITKSNFRLPLLLNPTLSNIYKKKYIWHQLFKINSRL